VYCTAQSPNPPPQNCPFQWTSNLNLLYSSFWPLKCTTQMASLSVQPLLQSTRSQTDSINILSPVSLTILLLQIRNKDELLVMLSLCAGITTTTNHTKSQLLLWNICSNRPRVCNEYLWLNDYKMISHFNKSRNAIKTLLRWRQNTVYCHAWLASQDSRTHVSLILIAVKFCTASGSVDDKHDTMRWINQ